MTETYTKHERNLSALIHASTFSRFFIPFGNFILPLILWTANKKDYEFVDQNGKQALNFQISLLLYSFIIGAISIPFFIRFLPDFLEGGLFNWDGFNHFNGFNIDFNHNNFRFGPMLWPIGISGVLHTGLFVVNVVYSILATIKTNEGEDYKYPFTINFIK